MKLRIERIPHRSSLLWAVAEQQPDGWQHLKVFTLRREAKAYIQSLGRLGDLRK